MISFIKEWFTNSKKTTEVHPPVILEVKPIEPAKPVEPIKPKPIWQNVRNSISEQNPLRVGEIVTLTQHQINVLGCLGIPVGTATVTRIELLGPFTFVHLKNNGPTNMGKGKALFQLIRVSDLSKEQVAALHEPLNEKGVDMEWYLDCKKLWDKVKEEKKS